MAAAISRTSMRSAALLADDDDFVAGLDVDVGDVDHHHVHADGADDRHAPAADQHEAAVAACGVSRPSA